MAKQRYIKDSFWTDPYIEKLSPDYKLVFVYLLTNPLSNISGVYEIRLKRMAFETGYDLEVIESILKQFVKDKKIIMVENWIIIVNHIKHQNLGELTAKGINREILEAPREVIDLFEEKTIENTKGDPYQLFVLKDFYKPLISPLQAPTFGALSRVKLSSSLSSKEEPKIDFEDFWKIYPKHVGKKKAKEYWDKLDLTKQTKAMADIPLRAEDRKWKEGFHKDPERYIKTEQWNDDIIKAKSNSPPVYKNQKDSDIVKILEAKTIKSNAI